MKTFKPAEGMSIDEIREAAMKILIDHDVDIVFEEDGSIMGGGSGRDSLNDIMEYYLEKEKYEYCAILKERLEAYDRQWPDRISA